MRTHRLHQKLRPQLFLSSWITLLTCPSLLSWQQEQRGKGIYTSVNNSWNWSWKESERQTNFLLKCRAWHFPVPALAGELTGNCNEVEHRHCRAPWIPNPFSRVLPARGPCPAGISSLPARWNCPGSEKETIGAIPNAPDVLLRGTGREPRCPWAVGTLGRTGAAQPCAAPSLWCPGTPAQELSALTLCISSVGFPFSFLFFAYLLHFCHLHLLLWCPLTRKNSKKRPEMVLAAVSTSDTTREESSSLREQRSTAGKELEVLDED